MMLEDDRGSMNGGAHPGEDQHSKPDAGQQRTQSIHIKLDKAEEDVPYGRAPELNGIVVLEGGCPAPKLFPVDLCFVLDASKSMGTFNRQKRLSDAILAALVQIVDKKPVHRVSIVVFNHEAKVLFDLAPLTHASLKLIETKLNAMVPFGSTDIGNGLWRGLKTLKDAIPSFDEGSPRIPALLLFTDGYTNRGVQPQDLIPQLKEVTGLDGLVIHTFGMGVEHNSWLAHGIAVMHKGLYFFVPDDDESFTDKIMEVLNDLTSNHLRNISVKLEAQAGARVTLVATPYTVDVLQPSKLYKVNVGNLHIGEVKTILLKFSLRRMSARMPQHHLMKVTVTYQEAHGGIYQASEDISVSRMKRKGKIKRNASNHPRIHNYINKYTFALALQKALGYATREDYAGAMKELARVIDMILNTPFAEKSAPLIDDIKKCQKYLENGPSFSVKQYAAYSMLTRYLMKTELCPIMNGQTNKTPLTLSSATDVGKGSPMGRSMEYVKGVLETQKTTTL